MTAVVTGACRAVLVAAVVMYDVLSGCCLWDAIEGAVGR